MGTANFGNVYGISNSSLRLPLVDKEIAERLVARAVSIGIDTFDTAQNYGPSLGWITDFSKDMKFRIWSKVSWIADEFQDFQNFTDYISTKSKVEYISVESIKNIIPDNYRIIQTKHKSFFLWSNYIIKICKK